MPGTTGPVMKEEKKTASAPLGPQSDQKKKTEQPGRVIQPPAEEMASTTTTTTTTTRKASTAAATRQSSSTTTTTTTTTTSTTTTRQLSEDLLRSQSAAPDADPPDLVPLQAVPSEEMMRPHRGKIARHRARSTIKESQERRWNGRFGKNEEKLKAGNLPPTATGEEVMERAFYSWMDQNYFKQQDGRMVPMNLKKKYHTPDPLGIQWRTHCRDFEKMPDQSPVPSMTPDQYLDALVEQDVKNLADYYYLELFLEDKIKLNPKFYKFVDMRDVEKIGLCFRVADNVGSTLRRNLDDFYRALEEKLRGGGTVDPELLAQVREAREEGPEGVLHEDLERFKLRVSGFVLHSKNTATNYIPSFMDKELQEHVHRLSLKSVSQMPDGEYRNRMKEMIEDNLKKVTIARADLGKQLDNIALAISSEAMTEQAMASALRYNEIMKGVGELSKIYRSRKGQPGASDDATPYLQYIFHDAAKGSKFEKLLVAVALWRAEESRRFEAEQEQRLGSMKAQRDGRAPEDGAT